MRLGIEGGLDPMAAAQRAAGDFPGAVTGTMERLLRRLRGDYREDRWGFDEDFAEAVFPFFEFLYEVWWRVDVEGVRNVPADGRALLVANHAGSVFPFGASMMTVALPRRVRGSRAADGGADDRSAVFDLSERVRETIQASLYRNLVKRGSAFL